MSAADVTAAAKVLRDRVAATISSMPPGAAARRDPENGVIVPMGALSTVLDALSSPPADDVREALARVIDPGAWAEMKPHPSIYEDDPESREVYEGYFREGVSAMRAPSIAAADRLLGSSAFEVRLRGTVTAAEVEAAERVLTGAADGDPWVQFEPGVVRAALIAAMGARS